MKTIAVMQPYFMPYIGYWQLVNAVDEYVIFDNVNYINRGWINRNRIFYSNAVRYIHMPILSVSQNKKINELEMSGEAASYRKILDIVRMAYKKAPYYEAAARVLEEIIMYPEKNAAKYLAHSIKVIANYFDMETCFFFSSEIQKDKLIVGGKEKILDICAKRKADRYINAIGGMKLYSKEEFSQKGIELKFLRPMGDKIWYQQFDREFIANLSIIDVMMFNNRESVRGFLNQYELL